MKHQNDRTMDRRGFIRAASMSALPMIALLGLGLEGDSITQVHGESRPPADCKDTCELTCKGGCEKDCTGGCMGTCKGTCAGECDKTCRAVCADTCTITSK